MKLAFLGAGYVGLVSGTCFASQGNNVTLVDIDENKINSLREGIIPIHEPGLKELVLENTREGRLKFTTNIKEAVQGSDIIFIAVGTPKNEHGEANLEFIHKAAKGIAENIDQDNKIVVCKSTVPPGTSSSVEKIITEITDKRVFVASNPEFLAEGRAVEDFLKPDRIVIGSEDNFAIEKLKELHSPFARRDLNKIIIMRRESSELTKYSANAMLAAKISLINEIASLADVCGADITEVREGIGSDSRIGKAFLFPGPGFGGSCFPKDVSALAGFGSLSRIKPFVLNSILKRNEAQKEVPYQKLHKLLGDESGKTIAIFGLAFKANTDDVRESSSVYLARKLISLGAKLRVHDPKAMGNFKGELKGVDITYTNSIYEAAEGANAIVIMTEWSKFRSPDFKKIFDLMQEPKVVVDARNLWDPKKIREIGFKYDSIGRP